MSKIMKSFNGYEIYDETARKSIEEITENTTRLQDEKANKLYVIEVFEELKTLIQSGQAESAIAVLDEAILDLSTLA